MIGFGYDYDVVWEMNFELFKYYIDISWVYELFLLIVLISILCIM